MDLPEAGRLVDHRGEIINIADGNFRAVQLIKSNAGSVRSNHYHKTGGHWLYVLSGEMVYRECPVECDDWTLAAKETTVKAGEKIWTGPMVCHATEFPVDTVLISCAIGPLDTAAYEMDTVRVYFWKNGGHRV